MTSRDHARRILLILLASEARGTPKGATDHVPLISSSGTVDDDSVSRRRPEGGGHASKGEWRPWRDVGGTSAMSAAAPALTGAA